MRVLITGGAGFIGSHLAAALSEDHAVTVLDDGSTGTPDRLPGAVSYVPGDIRDPDSLHDAIDDSTDCILHQAARVSVAHSIADPLDSHSVNTTGTLTVLEAARHHDTRVVLASSAAVYGAPQSLPIAESHPTTPTSPYGLEKLTADHYARLYHELYDLETVALRYFNVYGPGQTGGDYAGVIAVFIEQALAGEDITIHGDGEQTRDFVFVGDVVQANRAAITTDQVGASYNIGTGESVSIRELAELIQALTDTDADIVHTDPRAGDIAQSVADITNAQTHLHFRPRVSLREGLERTVAWWQSDHMSTTHR